MLLPANELGYCRITNNNGSYDLNDFSRLAGARCFTLLIVVFNSKINLPYDTIDDGLIMLSDSNHSLDLSDQNDIKYLQNYLSPDVFSKWKDCNDEAIKCCRNVMMHSNTERKLVFLLSENKIYFTFFINYLKVPSFTKKTCKAIWDGWTCHETTPAKKVSKVKCPAHIEASNCHSILGFYLFLTKFFFYYLY